MEHIIQFGVTVDDDLIRKRIIEQASETVIKETKKELAKIKEVKNQKGKRPKRMQDNNKKTRDEIRKEMLKMLENEQNNK